MIEINNLKFYTVLEVAKTLNINPLTVRNYIKVGRIKAQRIGRPYLISENALKEFLNATVKTDSVTEEQ